VPIAEIYPPLYCHVTSPRPFGLLPLDHNVGLDISPSLNLIGHQLSKDSVIIRVPAISDELLELHPLVHTGKAFPDVADYTLICASKAPVPRLLYHISIREKGGLADHVLVPLTHISRSRRLRIFLHEPSEGRFKRMASGYRKIYSSEILTNRLNQRSGAVFKRPTDRPRGINPNLCIPLNDIPRIIHKKSRNLSGSELCMEVFGNTKRGKGKKLNRMSRNIKSYLIFLGPEL
jgi:hypothetical protein